MILPATVHSAALGIDRRESPNQRNVVLHNKSGRRVDLFWINRSVDPIEFRSNSENGEGYPYGASQGITSYIGHEFEIREMPSKRTGECRIPGDCSTGYFQVNDQEGQKITIDKDFNVKHEDDRTLALDQAEQMLETCEKRAMQQGLDPLKLVDAIADCMEQKVNETLAKQEEERLFQSQLRQQMASELIPYACGDLNFTASIEVINRTWSYEEYPDEGYTTFQIQVLHERPTSTIFKVPDFAITQECQALKYFLSPDGSHVPLKSIKDKTKQGQYVNALANKIYELIRTALAWPDLAFDDQYLVDSQELFDVHKDTKGVSVLPTCTQEELDHYKSDRKHKTPTKCRLPGANHQRVETKQFEIKPNQVATIFLFCDQNKAAQLGGLHFPEAAVHINREPNLLVVAIHRTLKGPEMDGFTSNYHFCPNHDILTHSFFVDETKTTTTEPDNGPSNPANDEL